MASIQHSLVTKVTDSWPAERWHNVCTIVAVSGGPDSVAMLHALVDIHNLQPSTSGKLVVAHVDHGIRGDASAADARFVTKLAQQLGIPCESYGPDAAPKTDHSTGQSTGRSEDSLRAHRYRCLKQAAEKHGARYLATAHTQDDQIETVLFRILRGTGIRGLTGIPTFRSLSDGLTLVRPMLSVTRSEVLAFLDHISADFCVDGSNAQSTYTRNFLRNELLPLARKRFADVDQAIANLSQQAADQQAASAQWISIAANSIVAADDRVLEIDCDKLKGYPTATLIDALIDAWQKIGWSRGNINQATWHQVAQMILTNKANPPALNLPGNVRAERDGNRMRLTADRAGQRER